MALGILLILFAALVFGPTFWVRSVMARYAAERADYPGTGGELARHLLDEAGLNDVAVENGPGDFYDPDAKTVHLSKPNFEGRSLTAVAVAAHEVGHALQDRDGYGPLKARQRIVRTAMRADRIATAAAVALSVLGGAAISPRMLVIGFVVIFAAGLIRVVANLVTLPVEFDASFNRALPILANGYIPPDDAPGARRPPDPPRGSPDLRRRRPHLGAEHPALPATRQITPRSDSPNQMRPISRPSQRAACSIVPSWMRPEWPRKPSSRSTRGKRSATALLFRGF